MRKFVVFLLASMFLVTLTVFAGCNNTPKGKVGTLSIASFEGGYGKTWAAELAKEYKKLNPQVEVVVDTNPLVRDDAVTALQTGISAVDIFFIDGASIGTYLETYDTLYDISELYKLKPKAGETEEDILIKDKIYPEVLAEMSYGGDRSEFAGKYYTVPSPSGPASVILNTEALDNALGKGQWSEPRTTDELMTLADRIKAANAKVNVAGINHTVYPFIYSGSAAEYLRYMYYPWIAQYDGVQAWNDMQTVKKNGQYDQSAFMPDGKSLAFEIMEKILKRANNYCDPTSLGNSFSASQKYFFQNRACIYITGDWLEREMESATEYRTELKMIKSPVISGLAAKLEGKYSVSLGQSAAEKDQTLSNIISAIDRKETSLAGINQEVFDSVKEARKIVYSLANNAIGLVPKSSVNKDLAIDFLRFMYSEQGIEIVQRESRATLPVFTQVAAPSSTNFRKSVNEVVESGLTYIFSSTRDPIRYRAGMSEYMGNEKPEIALGKKTGAVSASQLVLKQKELLAQSWEDYMKLVK